MAYSERARRVVAERARIRNEQRDAAERQRQAEADAYHATHLCRERAAEFLQISVHRLKRLMAAGTGPACIKRGDTKQATVRWPLAELEAWKADPRGYNARRDATLPQ